MSRVSEILKNYSHRNAGTRAKLAQIMNTGELAGTGKMVILPVDQGFEHGPARSFAPNPKGYDPTYHVELALEAGCNAYAAPLGYIEAAANEFPGQIPLILKVNNNDSLFPSKNPLSAITSSINDALELGVSAIGYTIYPGTANKNENFGVLAEYIRQAHEVGMAAVVWSYPRGEAINKANETSIDIVSYAAHIAAQMGADIIKVKPPVANGIGLKAAEATYKNLSFNSLSERIEHVIQAAFNGERITIFSGGAAKGTDEVLDEIKQIHQGGGFGSIMGRNAFQRPKSEAIELLQQVMEIYKK